MTEMLRVYSNGFWENATIEGRKRPESDHNIQQARSLYGNDKQNLHVEERMRQSLFPLRNGPKDVQPVEPV